MSAITIAQLRELTALHVETAYATQALRYLTRAIEGEWTYAQAREAIQEMMP
jgi:hypothetical protein